MEYTMKWHKFITNFGLWAAALLNIAGAGTYFEAAEIAGVFGVCGALQVALAVFCIVVRFALARFKASGPKMLIALNVCAASTGIVFPAIISIAMGVPMTALLDGSSIASMVTSFAMAGYNTNYYAKRADMFVY